jgi:Gas vesicle protein G
MGPLTTLLSLPVSGPLSGLGWIARQIAAAARQQMLDPKRIETALLLLERRLEDGQIDEATFEAEEALLLEELAEIGAIRAAEANGEAESPDQEPAEPEPPLVVSAKPDEGTPA